MKNITIHAKARIADGLMLSYRTPAAFVRGLLPRGLELVTRGSYAFWNVVAYRVQGMRPAWLPAQLGVSYRHVAYRLHVDAHVEGRNLPLRGFYCVRSDADSALVGQFGNVFTDFRFHPAGVELSEGDGVLTLAVQGRRELPDPRAGEPVGDVGDAVVRVALDEPANLAPPRGSPFSSAAEAERVLKVSPIGLAVDLDGRYLKLTEALRDKNAWSERPVRVIESHFRFFDTLGLGRDEVQLERAVRVASNDCTWRLGRQLALALLAPRDASRILAPVQPARAAA